MIKNIYCSFLMAFGLFASIPSKSEFVIISNSNSKEDIVIMYEYKNEIIENYAKMMIGLEEKTVIEDLLLMYPEMTYEKNQLIYVIGDGNGKQIKGELKSNYCDVEVKPKSFIAEMFK